MGSAHKFHCHVPNSIVTVQCRFKNQYKCKEVPAGNTVKLLVKQFHESGSVVGKKRGGYKMFVHPKLLTIFVQVWLIFYMDSV